MVNILIVDDEPLIRGLIREHLEHEGFICCEAGDGGAALSYLAANKVDMVILDIMMPFVDGMTCLREMRKRKLNTPVIMLTARGEEYDRIAGLENGADDYIVKPFSPRELVARVKAHRSRYDRLTGSGQGEPEAITLGSIQILPQSWKVMKDGQEIKMPNREFALLKYLAEHPNTVFSKEKLFETIWGYEYMGDSATVTVHIGRIRDKVEDDPAHPRLIETVWGAGYRLNRV